MLAFRFRRTDLLFGCCHPAKMFFLLSHQHCQRSAIFLPFECWPRRIFDRNGRIDSFYRNNFDIFLWFCHFFGPKINTKIKPTSRQIYCDVEILPLNHLPEFRRISIFSRANCQHHHQKYQFCGGRTRSRVDIVELNSIHSFSPLKCLRANTFNC